MLALVRIHYYYFFLPSFDILGRTARRLFRWQRFLSFIEFLFRNKRRWMFCRHWRFKHHVFAIPSPRPLMHAPDFVDQWNEKLSLLRRCNVRIKIICIYLRENYPWCKKNDETKVQAVQECQSFTKLSVFTFVRQTLLALYSTRCTLSKFEH